MKRVINLDNWNRKEHFKFFSALDDPFWGITMTVDFTSIYQQSKNMEVSFFLYSVHFLLKCINATVIADKWSSEIFRSVRIMKATIQRVTSEYF